MLSFFRKYQRYFFVFITIVIVISFSFFGTYSTLQTPHPGESIAFTAIDGTPVTRQELDEMALFLSTDMEDKQYFGGIWGPNFLNDGVITKDFFQTGIAELLAAQYSPLLEDDYMPRLSREKSYSLYVHPQARFISTEATWAYFAPQMKEYFQTLKEADDPLASEPFHARVQLYLAEKRFPSPMLKQMIRYQEKQQSWLTPDQNLDRLDLSLFGYHTVDDWFGPRFVKIMAQFVINSAIIAKEQGYEVSQGEAASDLIRNAQFSFQQNARSPYLAVKNSQEYFQEQLRRMGLDQTKAVKLWQKVLLFRRLFHDAGSSMFVDPTIAGAFVEYAKEPFGGEIYNLPEELQLGDYSALQKFEVYLDAVSKRTPEQKAKLSLPNQFLSIADVAEKAPELVQKKYRLLIADADAQTLATKVSIVEMWNWEVSDDGWAMLIKEFPELGIKKGNSREERFAALDDLDNKKRTQVDAFARKQVAKQHPEWIDTALNSKESTEEIVAIPLKGPFQLKGIEDTQSLIKLLDRAPLVSEKDSTSNEALATQQKLARFSGDQRHFYKIQVLERKPQSELMTFAAANKSGALDRLLNQTLEAYYPRLRSDHVELFQQADKAWKPYDDVKDLIADFYFADVLKAISASTLKNSDSKNDKKLSGSLAASKRLLPYMTEVKDALANSSGSELSEFVASSQEKQPAEQEWAPAKPLIEQWKLQKETFHIDRSTPNPKVDRIELMALPMEGWSAVHDAPNGAIYFYQKLETKSFGDQQLIVDKSNQAYRLLGNAIQRAYSQQLLKEFYEKNAISLAYLNTGTEIIPEE